MLVIKRLAVPPVFFVVSKIHAINLRIYFSSKFVGSYPSSKQKSSQCCTPGAYVSFVPIDHPAETNFLIVALYYVKRKRKSGKSFRK